MGAWVLSAMRAWKTFWFFCQKIDILGQTSERCFSQKKALILSDHNHKCRMIPSINGESGGMIVAAILIGLESHATLPVRIESQGKDAGLK
jgi:hypothetical protein